MKTGTAVILILGLYLVAEVSSSEDDAVAQFISTGGVSPSTFESGKKRVDEIISRSNLPRYGECWTGALQDLKVACKILDNNVQSKLAFAFTSCFMEMLGFPPYMCEKSANIKECVKNLDDRGYNTFLEYFLHTQDMCFFLMSQVWQDETDKTVNQLASAAIGVSKNLEQSKSTQEKILQSQEETLKVQNNIMKDNGALYNAVLRVRQVFDDFKIRANEHQLIFAEIFEKLSKMQLLVSWIQGEMSLLDMFGFYFVAVVFGALATTTKQTNNARFWLVILFPTVFMLERYLYSLFTHNDYSPEYVQNLLWWYRRFACGVAFAIVAGTAYCYRDFNTMHGKSLEDVNRKLAQLLSLAQNSPGSPHFVGFQQGLKEISNGQEDDSSDSDSDTSSAYSKDSDSCSDSDSSQEIDASERLLLVNDVKDLIPFNDKENNPLSLNKPHVNIVEDEPGAPILASTPKFMEQTPARYNLRARKTPVSNPVLGNETPKTFARKIKANFRKSSQYNRGGKGNQDSFYSSGDEL